MRDFPARHSFSSTSSAGTDLGAANPTAAVVPEPGLSDHQLHGKHRRIVSALETDEVKELWRCMVELQERYGCYRSARMQAVVSAPRPTELMRELGPSLCRPSWRVVC